MNSAPGQPYPIRVVHRRMRSQIDEYSPADLFDEPLALAINKARLDNLGGGPGHLSQFFIFQWRNNGMMEQDGHAIRLIFIASKRPLVNGNLLSLVEYR
jgi:hypothetical protein